jgi:hypothetical protein
MEENRGPYFFTTGSRCLPCCRETAAAFCSLLRVYSESIRFHSGCPAGITFHSLSVWTIGRMNMLFQKPDLYPIGPWFG